MKRIITAALLAALAAPAFAVEIGAPYEQTQVDRQLPNVQDPVVAGQASSSSTYEEYKIDTALPNVNDPVVTPRTQVAGPVTELGSQEPAFANDFNFIAPAQ